MALRYKAALRFPEWMVKPPLPPEKLQAMADIRKRQVLDTIEAGGNGEVAFILNSQGRKPLGGAAGRLGQSLVAFVEGEAFGVRSEGFAGAEVLLKGTVGKGGALPTIAPKKAKALRFAVGDVVRFAMRVDIPPRPFLLMSRADKVELAGVLFGQSPPRTI